MPAQVLVVDDDPAVARTVSRILGARGFQVTVVHDATAAIAEMRAHTYDALVLDFQLGDSDANDLLGKLTADRLPAVLVLSGSISVGDTVEAMKLGVGDVVQKPFDPDDLVTRLEKLLARASAVRTVPIPMPRAHRVSKLGTYEVRQMIATGGMSTVYRAEHQVTGAPVALKVLDPQYAARPDMIDRLLAELEVSRRIDHPGLAKVIAGERTRDGLPFLVLELVEGRSLSTIIDQRGGLPTRTVASIGAQIASALAALHGAGIGHADLKPDNVLVVADLGPDGEPLVKLIDFGVAYFADRAPERESQVWGTPVYLAPEQWTGTPGLASDVYALGCMIHELATGAPPFVGTVDELAHAHLEQIAPSPSARTPAAAPFDAIVARALAKAPAQRPSMVELAAELAALAASAR